MTLCTIPNKFCVGFCVVLGIKFVPQKGALVSVTSLLLFPRGRSGMVQVLGCKVLLVVLCGGRLQEKYRYLFNQVADHNNCCTR